MITFGKNWNILDIKVDIGEAPNNRFHFQFGLDTCGAFIIHALAYTDHNDRGCRQHSIFHLKKKFDKSAKRRYTFSLYHSGPFVDYTRGKEPGYKPYWVKQND